jgi:O-antigen/teichoic acid export membrane protein
MIYADSYRLSEQLFRLLLIGNFVNLYVIFLPPIYEALRRYKSLNIIVVLQMLLNLLVDWILIPRFGVTGAAIATNFGYIVMAAATEYYFRKHILKQCRADAI